MKRYDIAPIIKNADGIRQLKTVLISAGFNSSDTIIETTSPHRLDKIANDFYGDPTLWWIIATVNNVGKGTLIVPAGTTIRVPDKDRVLDEIEIINKNR
jgi:hypothetical protein